MKKLVAMAGALLILCGCAPERQSENSYKTNSYFAADHLGIYYVTQERTVRFIPFSEDTAAEYGHEIGLLNGLSDIVSICAESDGNIGTIDAEGMYYTTHNIQPEQSEDFIPDSSGSIGAGSGQLASVAKQFDGLSDIVFFRSSYPSWGLFVHRDDSVTIPVLEESRQKIFDNWTNITQLAGTQDIIALTTEGTILYEPDSPYRDTYENWTDISALYSDYTSGIFAKTNQGDVLYAGDNRWGEGNVDHWHNIVSIAPERSFTVGLCSDGTVVAAGANDCGQCDVSDWVDIVAVAVSDSVGIDGATTYTAGLDRCGNVLISGMIHGVSYHGIYFEAAAQNYVDLDTQT